MLAFLLRRLVLTVPVLLGLSVITFAIARLLPGDPVLLAAGPEASPETVAALAKEFGLDKPLLMQYWSYLTGLLNGDWGQSLLSRRPVLDDLKIYLPATLELVLVALLFAVVVGIPLGLLSAVYRDKWVDYFARVFALGAISVPRFFLGLLLQLFFAMWLNLLPLSGRFPLTLDPPPTQTGFLVFDALLSGQWESAYIAMGYIVLPAFAMSLSPLATIMRMMRASSLEVLQQDYVQNARALGLSRFLIVAKYVTRNAISSTLTVIGLYFGWLLGGTVLVETVFDWPGIGLYATKAILTQDFQPIMGVVLCIGTLFVLMNLVIDMLYGWVNPKVRHG